MDVLDNLCIIYLYDCVCVCVREREKGETVTQYVNICVYTVSVLCHEHLLIVFNYLND